MTKIYDEIRYDIEFLRSHTLQPKWYKVLKVFLVLSAVAIYFHYFGLRATIIFLAGFTTLSLIMHFTYRSKTKKYRQSWHDFFFFEESGILKYKRIGFQYYLLVLAIFLISITISQIVCRK